MRYYHVAIANKSGKVRWAFAFNMSKGQIDERIVLPFKQQRPFMCSKRVIQPSEIEFIRISETDEKYSEILAKIGKRRTFRKVMSQLMGGRGEEDEYVDEWYVIEAGKDVTRELIGEISLPIDMPEEIPKASKAKNIIFIVHGRDDKQALLLQKYLNKSGKKAVVFDDLPDKGKTVIEQLEYIRDHVYYAFVIVTPDDVGCLSEETQKIIKMIVGLTTVNEETVTKTLLQTLNVRARQNVVFELGLFLGALGRENVCCLLHKDIKERPSDIDGVLYKQFDRSVTEVFHEIAEELK